MPNFVHTHELRADLRNGVTHRCGGVLLGKGDDSADVFTIKPFDNQLPLGYDLTGDDATACTGYFVRPDGTTVIIAGTVSNGVGTVTLPAVCYTHPGEFSLAVKFSSSAADATLVIFSGRILTTYTDEVADPDDVWSIDSIISAIQQKVDEPPQEGTSGQALLTDGDGGRYWGSVEQAQAVGKVIVDNTEYTLRTGTTGAAGYITLVPETT